MKNNKDLQFCLGQLRSMLNNENEYEPEQRKLKGALKGLKGLGRKTNPTRVEIYRAVRHVAEAILDVLNRK